jgi:hypothetical protein
VIWNGGKLNRYLELEEIREGGRTMTRAADGSFWPQNPRSLRAIDPDGVGWWLVD